MPKAKPVDTAELSAERDAFVPLSRLSVPLNADGSIDMSTAKPSTVAKLKKAVELSGMSAPSASIPPEKSKFPRSAIPGIYDSIAVAARTVGRIALAWPNELAAELKFSKEEKENLTEPTGEMLDKYLEKASKYAVEIAFFNALGANLASMTERAVSMYTAKLNAYPGATVQEEPKPATPSPAEIPQPAPEVAAVVGV